MGGGEDFLRSDTLSTGKKGTSAIIKGWIRNPSILLDEDLIVRFKLQLGMNEEQIVKAVREIIKIK
nr:hypothetical protein [Candidatus Gracilibacteria bacterium]